MGRKGPGSKRFVSGTQLFMDKPEWKPKFGEQQETFIRRVFRKMRDPYKVAEVARKRGTRLREGRLRRMVKRRPVEGGSRANLRRPQTN
ncbi:MAG: hypothetical protein HYW05_01240 [Candidatus Diapherotrites archaeon]|nr:hypothetical protein [Candidatus Diapherotrites archaeon]